MLRNSKNFLLSANSDCNRCIVCLIKTIHVLSFLISPVIFHCFQSSNVTTESSFSLKYSSLRIYYTAFCCELLGVVLYIYLAFKDCPTSNARCVFLLSDLILVLNGCSVLFFKIFSIRRDILISNCWTRLYENRSNFCIENASLEPHIATMKWLKLRYFVATCYGTLSFGVSHIIFAHNVDYIYVKTFVICVSVLFQITALFEALQQMKFLHIIYSYFSRSLKFKLTSFLDSIQRLESYNKVTTLVQDSGELYILFAENIKRLSRFYGAYIENVNLVTKNYEALALLWGPVVTLHLMLHVYTVVKIDYSGYSYDILEMTVIWLCSHVTLIYLLSESQKVYDMNQDILSFLFTYPISKLTTTEAAQIEMLIATLTIQRPIFRASNTFIVGTGLLGGIYGTILTYVLVALQFHSAWKND